MVELLRSGTFNSTDVRFFFLVVKKRHLEQNVFLLGEKVRTTKITTSKTKKNSENSVDDQNIEKIY